MEVYTSYRFIHVVVYASYGFVHVEAEDTLWKRYLPGQREGGYLALAGAHCFLRTGFAYPFESTK